MTKIIGHRGSPANTAENSIAGFRSAIGMGVDGLELDVHLTKEGELVVIHDPLLERTTTGTGPVHLITMSDLANISLKKEAGETVPTLEEVLDLVEDCSLEIQIEIKTDVLGRHYPGIEHRLAQALGEKPRKGEIILTSFSPHTLTKVRDALPDLRLLASINNSTATAFGGLDAAFEAFRNLNGCIFAIQKSILEHSFHHCVETVGLDRIGVWVVNTPAEVIFWSERNVRHIVSDNPSVTVAARNDFKSGAIGK